MRIGVNTLFLIPGEVGGSETYLRRTLKALVAARPNWEFVLFVNEENGDMLSSDLAGSEGVHFEKLAFRAVNRFSRIIREQTQLVSRIKRSGIDLLWSPGYTTPLFCPCPMVTSILDMQYRTHPEDLSFMARLATDVLVRGACRKSRRLATISRFGQKEIATHTATAENKIHVTPLAAGADFAKTASEDELGPEIRRLRADGVPYLLVVANTYPHKKVETAVAAFGSIMDRIPHRLVLVGRPRRGEGAVQTAVAALSDRSRCTRIEYLDGKRDLAALYQGADAFLFPSIYEGFGLPVLEAMQAGTPVVTTGAAAIAEVAGESALFFDPQQDGDFAAKILQVIEWTPGERTAWTEKACRHASSFTWEKTAEATARVFESALKP